jgi:hypothetical protein
MEDGAEVGKRKGHGGHEAPGIQEYAPFQDKSTPVLRSSSALPILDLYSFSISGYEGRASIVMHFKCTSRSRTSDCNCAPRSPKLGSVANTVSKAAVWPIVCVVVLC